MQGYYRHLPKFRSYNSAIASIFRPVQSIIIVGAALFCFILRGILHFAILLLGKPVDKHNLIYFDCRDRLSGTPPYTIRSFSIGLTIFTSFSYRSKTFVEKDFCSIFHTRISRVSPLTSQRARRNSSCPKLPISR